MSVENNGKAILKREVFAGKFKFGQRVVIDTPGDTYEGRHGAVISDRDESTDTNTVAVDDVYNFTYRDQSLVPEAEYRLR